MRCENCGTEITFFMTLRQAIPQRFRCLKCNARYRVRAPHLGLIFLGIIAAFAALLYEFATGMAAYGPSFIIPFMLVAAGVWLLFELLLYRHITRNGSFIRLDAAASAMEEAFQPDIAQPDAGQPDGGVPSAGEKEEP